ncbi:MAG TPA: exo-beta-N-acetylmuramidase NamZ domain-containing protein [Humisphaera sp.]
MSCVAAGCATGAPPSAPPRVAAASPSSAPASTPSTPPKAASREASAAPPTPAAPSTTTSPTTAAPPFDLARMAEADKAIDAAIARGELPGAVLLVGRGDRTGGQVLYRKAYGNRAVKPAVEPMTPDTVFDMASLTKPVATATAAMLLVERGLVNVDDPVAKYLPEFGKRGKEKITVAHLLLHFGGLIPDNAIGDYKDGPAAAWERICDLPTQTEPGAAFKYTDVGFITLGKLVERVSGQPLNKFVAENLFGPAAMRASGYLPPEDLKSLAAPTEQRDGQWMRGEVHDPRAYALGGVAGHAGLFSSADDTARYCRMILNGGTIDGVRVLKPQTVALMTAPRKLPNGTAVRTYGFDCDTPYSGPRGDRFAKGTTFGHTGFTGTSLWIDPVNDCFVVLLTNSVHPDGKGKVLALRRQVGTVAGEALLGPAPATRPATGPTTSSTAAKPATAEVPVVPGIDVLAGRGFDLLKGKRVALVTNQSGLTADGRRTVDVLHKAPGVTLVKLFSPEHGLFGLVDEKVADAKDPATGLHVHSLYGERRKPTKEALADVDVLVFDVQDAGARYYTYSATLGLCMEACGEANVRMVVLDRPNPVTGTIVDGPPADADLLGFTAYAPVPISHGMTLGELARYYAGERGVKCDLEVVPCQNWRRAAWFDETNLLWVNPSPNLRNPTQALLYLGVGQIESANVSVGRGTDEPFATVGAPWVDARKLAAALNAEGLPGLRFTPIAFTPTSSKFAKQPCHGVNIAVTDRQAVRPVRLGVALAWHLRAQFGKQFELDKVNALLKNKATLARLKTAKSPADVWAEWEPEVAAFLKVREKYLMYK